MEDSNRFTLKLSQVLEQKKDHLNVHALPTVAKYFQNIKGTFENIYTILVRKSLIREDPYKTERKFSEIEVPANTEVGESEKIDQISMRLSEFDNQLGFLSSYYQFSTEFLSLKRIKLLVGLTKFITWDKISSASLHINTRMLSELLSKVRGGSDTLAIQVLNNSQNQIADYCAQIQNYLKELTHYHREMYKLQIRQNVISFLKLTQKSVQEDKNNTLLSIRQRFAGSMQGVPFYQELVEEVLNEDFSDDFLEKQEAVLKKLQVSGPKTTSTKQESYRSYITEGFRILGTAGRHIARALVKLNDSSTAVENHRLKQESPLTRWLHKILRLKQEDREYRVEFVDVATSVARSDTVAFEKFLKNGHQTAKILTTFSNRMSAGFSRLNSLDEAEAFQRLEKLIVETQKIARTAPALHELFESAVDRETREKMRGVKLEMNAIQNAIVKSNQQRHEYVSRTEEQAQLAKLGVAKD